MTAPLDLSDDEREMLRVAVLDEDDVTMRLLQKLSDARAALRDIVAVTKFTDAAHTLAKVALAGTTAPVAVPATDPVQDIQREGSITHADLMAVRERYGALYAAVFPLVPRIVESYCDSHRDIDGEHARICLAQIKACK